jgi:hydroxymethylpyrimidine/phosphomethylpyrimidine kinase
MSDYRVAAVKTGMLPTHEVIEETARLIEEFGIADLVVDPVVRSTSGFDLIDDDALRSLMRRLFPLARVVTPNLPEAERITASRSNRTRMSQKRRNLFRVWSKKRLDKGWPCDRTGTQESTRHPFHGK